MKKKNAKKKPLASWLPQPFGGMTRRQLDPESDRYDADFAGVCAKRVANKRPHPRRPIERRLAAAERAIASGKGVRWRKVRSDRRS